MSAGGVWRARRVVFDEVAQAQAHERPRGDERRDERRLRLAAVKVKPSPCLSAEPPLRPTARPEALDAQTRPRRAGCTAGAALSSVILIHSGVSLSQHSTSFSSFRNR